MRQRKGESGIAMILVILVIVILYLVTTQVVYTSRLEDLSASNEAVMLRMDVAMRQALDQAVQALIDDVGQGAGDAEGGAMPGPGGLPAPGGEGGGGAGDEGGEQPEEEPPCDSKNDMWCRPAAFADGEITIYGLVVDENRKLNLLSIISKDEEFARDSRERLARLIDYLREHTEFDIPRTDAEMMVTKMVEYMNGVGRPEALGRPIQLSDKEGEDVKLPKTVEEFLVLPCITEFLLFDQVRGDLFLRGLRSVVTVYTSQNMPEMDPPENLTHVPSATGGSAGGAGDAGGSGAEPPGNGPAEPGAPKAETAIGLGIRINVNTAPRAVLRSLLPEVAIPRQVWEAVLEYRNEQVEEDEDASEDDELSLEDELRSTGAGPQTRVFTAVEDLDEVEEFKNWGVEEDREKLFNLLSVESDVFTIYLAATVRINEEKGVVFTRRAKAVVRREMGGDAEEPRIIWITPLIETETNLVIDFPDFPELERERQEEMEFDGEFADMTARDIYWDPFRFEFYCRKNEGINYQPAEKR